MYTSKMTEENNPLQCPKGSKFCCLKQTCLSVPPAQGEWTRIAPMGASIKPRIIPPTKCTSERGQQTNIHLKEVVIVPKRPVIPRDYEVNPRLKTMYDYHFNDTGDAILGYCDNRTIPERLYYFKNCQRVQDDLLLAIKEGGKSKIRRYKSDYNKRISEYMAETSFIGKKILRNRIHDHSNCGKIESRCVHYINF